MKRIVCFVFLAFFAVSLAACHRLTGEEIKEEGIKRDKENARVIVEEMVFVKKQGTALCFGVYSSSFGSSTKTVAFAAVPCDEVKNMLVTKTDSDKSIDNNPVPTKNLGDTEKRYCEKCNAWLRLFRSSCCR